MPLSEKAVQCITALTYPVQFESDISAGVDRVLRRVINAPRSMVTREEYVQYIQEVLSSDADLTSIDLGAHNDQAIRNFLSSIRDKLEAQIQTELAAQHAAQLAARLSQS